MRVPMLVRYPKRLRKGKTIDEMVLNIGIAPAFLELVGLPVRSQNWNNHLKNCPVRLAASRLGGVIEYGSLDWIGKASVRTAPNHIQ